MERVQSKSRWQSIKPSIEASSRAINSYRMRADEAGELLTSSQVRFRNSQREVRDCRYLPNRFTIDRTGALDKMLEGAAIRYRVQADLAGRRFEIVTVDVGFADWLDQPHDRIKGPDFFGFAGIQPVEVLAFPSNCTSPKSSTPIRVSMPIIAKALGSRISSTSS
jgi:hypothetical protein